MGYSNLQFYLYYILLYSIYLLYFLSLFNLYQTPAKYITLLNMIYRFLIGFILLITYNPIYPLQVRKEHNEIAFTAGLYIILDIVTSYYGLLKTNLTQLYK